MDMALAKERFEARKCPYCGADRKYLERVDVEIDPMKEVSHVIDCTACEKHFTEIYSFNRVILTDHPGEDFRIFFND